MSAQCTTTRRGLQWMGGVLPDPHIVVLVLALVLLVVL
jgi:hypothetical protein